MLFFRLVQTCRTHICALNYTDYFSHASVSRAKNDRSCLNFAKPPKTCCTTYSNNIFNLVSLPISPKTSKPKNNRIYG